MRRGDGSPGPRLGFERRRGRRAGRRRPRLRLRLAAVGAPRYLPASRRRHDPHRQRPFLDRAGGRDLQPERDPGRRLRDLRRRDAGDERDLDPGWRRRRVGAGRRGEQLDRHADHGRAARPPPHPRRGGRAPGERVGARRSDPREHRRQRGDLPGRRHLSRWSRRRRGRPRPDQHRAEQHGGARRGRDLLHGEWNRRLAGEDRRQPRQRRRWDLRRRRVPGQRLSRRPLRCHGGRQPRRERRRRRPRLRGRHPRPARQREPVGVDRQQPCALRPRWRHLRDRPGNRGLRHQRAGVRQPVHQRGGRHRDGEPGAPRSSSAPPRVLAVSPARRS